MQCDEGDIRLASPNDEAEEQSYAEEEPAHFCDLNRRQTVTTYQNECIF